MPDTLETKTLTWKSLGLLPNTRYTDGITDPIMEIVNIVEEENQRRAALSPPAAPVTLINDCCLAFSVWCTTMGRGQERQCVCDMSTTSLPVLITLDAHKHIGSDKGISTVVGTPGTLSALRQIRWERR